MLLRLISCLMGSVLAPALGMISNSYISVCMHACMHEIPENINSFDFVYTDVCIGDGHAKEAGGHVYSGC